MTAVDAARRAGSVAFSLGLLAGLLLALWVVPGPSRCLEHESHCAAEEVTPLVDRP